MLRPIVARTWDQLQRGRRHSPPTTPCSWSRPGRPGAAPLAVGYGGVRPRFAGAVEAVARSLARQQAADGEGATSLITCQVSGAADDVDARARGAGGRLEQPREGRRPRARSQLGAHRGRRWATRSSPDAAVLEAAGLSADEARARGGQAVELDPARLRIAIEGMPVFAGLPVRLRHGRRDQRAMAADEVLIRVDLGLGTGAGEAFGCDLTEAYVVENSEPTRRERRRGAAIRGELDGRRQAGRHDDRGAAGRPARDRRERRSRPIVVWSTAAASGSRSGWPGSVWRAASRAACGSPTTPRSRSPWRSWAASSTPS